LLSMVMTLTPQALKPNVAVVQKHARTSSTFAPKPFLAFTFKIFEVLLLASYILEFRTSIQYHQNSKADYFLNNNACLTVQSRFICHIRYLTLLVFFFSSFHDDKSFD
jgi:hypothetical protein